MDQRRKKIMLAFQYEENWIGGTYYILNIIRSLKTLPDEMKPALTILCKPGTSTIDIDEIGYPYLEYFSFHKRLPLWQRAINKLLAPITTSPFFKIRIPLAQIDNFYPAPLDLDKSNIVNYYSWIPDFQEHYLPEYFNEREIADRKSVQRKLMKSRTPLVFSSNNAREDFDKFYPENENKKVVLPFVSVLNTNFTDIDLHELKSKYAITKPYFIIANQFWKHKNHATAIHAFEKLLKDYPDVQLVLTGKEHDYRNPEYPAMLKKYVYDKGLSNSILFLGFIDRREQLALIKNSLAVIQPSLFEGWSTVVEDAKALDVFIVLSDIPLHREQIQESCAFFSPSDVDALKESMLKVLNSSTASVQHFYSKRINAFAENFMKLF